MRMKKFWRWLTGPKRVRVEGVYLGHPDIVSMCPFRGDALIAMADGTVYHAIWNDAQARPEFQKIMELRIR